MGSSGSGKSIPTSGRYLINGVDVSELDDNQLAQVRNRHLGFVYHSFNLVKRTSAQANVELPLVYAHRGPWPSRRGRGHRARRAHQSSGQRLWASGCRGS